MKMHLPVLELDADVVGGGQAVLPADAEAAHAMLAAGHAYHCYASPEELAEMRAAAKAAGGPMRQASSASSTCMAPASASE